MEFQALNFGLAQPQLWQTFGKWTIVWKISISLSLGLQRLNCWSLQAILQV